MKHNRPKWYYNLKLPFLSKFDIQPNEIENLGKIRSILSKFMSKNGLYF